MYLCPHEAFTSHLPRKHSLLLPRHNLGILDQLETGLFRMWRFENLIEILERELLGLHDEKVDDGDSYNVENHEYEVC